MLLAYNLPITKVKTDLWISNKFKTLLADSLFYSLFVMLPLLKPFLNLAFIYLYLSLHLQLVTSVQFYQKAVLLKKPFRQIKNFAI